MRPAVADLRLPSGEWTLDVLDTWAMASAPLPGRFSGVATVPSPVSRTRIRAQRLAE